MSDDSTIRLARVSDVAGISGLIARTLRTTNAADYAPAVIEDLVTQFSSERVRRFLADRDVFVVTKDGAVVATASLKDARVHALFVSPDRQRRGLATRLMDHMERLAAARGLDRLNVHASITAVAFYESRGYRKLRDHWYGEEQTIVMEKDRL